MSAPFLVFTFTMCLIGAVITAYVGSLYGLIAWVAILTVLVVTAAAAVKGEIAAQKAKA